MISSLQEEQKLLDNQSDNNISSIEPSIGDAMYSNAKTSIISKENEINQAVTLLRGALNKNVIGLDCEWPVTLNDRGYPISSGKVAMIQICYLDFDNKMQVLFIRTEKLKKLPHRLESLLSDEVMKIVGVRVSTDLIRIGVDFRSDVIQRVPQKDR